MRLCYPPVDKPPHPRSRERDPYPRSLANITTRVEPKRDRVRAAKGINRRTGCEVSATGGSQSEILGKAKTGKSDAEGVKKATGKGESTLQKPSSS